MTVVQEKCTGFAVAPLVCHSSSGHFHILSYENVLARPMENYFAPLGTEKTGTHLAVSFKCIETHTHLNVALHFNRSKNVPYAPTRYIVC